MKNMCVCWLLVVKQVNIRFYIDMYTFLITIYCGHLTNYFGDQIVDTLYVFN